MPDFHKPTMIKSNGINLAVFEERPAGKAHKYPVVMVHGMPELAYSWRLQFDALVKAGFHAIAPDMRGTGYSDSPPNREDFTVQKRLDDICGLLDHYGYDKCIVVGHDFGGMVSWGMGIYRPDRTAGVISMNCPFPDIPMSPLEMYEMVYGPKNYVSYFQTQECEDKLNADPARSFRFFLRRDTGQGDNLSRSKKHDAESMAYIHWLDDPESSWPGEILGDNEEIEYYAQAYKRTGFRGCLNWYRCLPLEFENQKKVFPNGMPRLKMPVLGMGSDKDYICDWSLFQNLPEKCEDVEMVLIPNAGHWSQQENAPFANAAITDWLGRRFG